MGLERTGEDLRVADKRLVLLGVVEARSRRGRS